MNNYLSSSQGVYAFSSHVFRDIKDLYIVNMNFVIWSTFNCTIIPFAFILMTQSQYFINTNYSKLLILVCFPISSLFVWFDWEKILPSTIYLRLLYCSFSSFCPSLTSPMSLSTLYKTFLRIRIYAINTDDL